MNSALDWWTPPISPRSNLASPGPKSSLPLAARRKRPRVRPLTRNVRPGRRWKGWRARRSGLAAGLDSLFFDEGFGTLDPDALDVVAGAIEELGASGRMVCIVTHIRELAERMPVRFEVSKGPATSSVERVEV